ncbi:MAG: histidine phosphatase family protein [Chlamydiales bacterium]|nr:histidine phosphatase family protein [Chlamydiales bacterium]
MILKKEFYFIRHGQTDYNTSSQKVDHDDVSLNSVGFQQAKAVEPIMANLSIKSVCFSPLKRAKETKEAIAARLQAAYYEIAELRECSTQIWNDMTSCGAYAYHDSRDHVRNFMQRTLSGINQALSYEGPALIIAHGGIHWAMCCLMSITGHEWAIDNCLPVHFSLTSEGNWKARKLA